MRQVVLRLVAALVLVATVTTTSAATASADSGRPDLREQHTAPARHDARYDTADWWF